MKIKSLLAFALLVALPLTACATSVDEEDDGDDAEVDDETRNEAVATTSDALGRACYCAGAYACGHSRSPSYMHPKARTALAAAGVPTSALTQTYGDAKASVGTHCPEPGTSYSLATDMAQGGNPCGRVRKLRAQGFAAWFRTAPEFPGNLHIHAVYAGAPGMKASLKRQVTSFLQGRNGLASNAIDNHCPISAADKAAVQAALNGAGAPAAPTLGGCVVGGSYCGQDKVPGNPGTLYRCDGATASVIRVCPNGCSVNTGRDDSCK